MRKHIQLRYSNDLPGALLQRNVERFALADRRSLKCRFGEPCDPRQLLRLYDVKKLLETHKDYETHFGRSLHDQFEARWSGATLHIPDGEHIVMINPAHSMSRRTFTIAHEFGHLAFCHQPIIIDGGMMPYPRYSDEQEMEAHSYALAVLLPYAPLLQMVRQGASTAGIAYLYGVSTAAVEMRLKITGLWGLLTAKVLT